MRAQLISVAVVCLVAVMLTACDTSPPRFVVPLDVGFVVALRTDLRLTDTPSNLLQ